MKVARLDPKIHLGFGKKSGRSPEHVCFIHDREANVSVPLLLGMQGHHSLLMVP